MTVTAHQTDQQVRINIISASNMFDFSNMLEHLGISLTFPVHHTHQGVCVNIINSINIFDFSDMLQHLHDLGTIDRDNALEESIYFGI